MKNTTLKTISGILLIFLGLCHQTVHVLFELNPEKPPIVGDMQNFKIEMMGIHTLLEFHNGFSIMTGHFIICIGIIVLVIRKIEEKSIDISLVLIISSISVISVFYFHVLAYGISGLAAVFYLLAMKKRE